VAERPDWTFITSHGFVLLEVRRSPDATVREIASRAGVTERQAHRVLADLAAEGYIIRQRVGRRNHYRVNTDQPMRHPAAATHQVGDLLAALESL
jgi:DNA-binding IclR family transcriptional regulator